MTPQDILTIVAAVVGLALALGWTASLTLGDDDAEGHFRGHPTTFDGEHWRYDDTGAIAGFGYEVRPCAKCGLVFEGSNAGDPDPCLGNLPGVTNACCGHGVRADSYICFEGGLSIRGFEVMP